MATTKCPECGRPVHVHPSTGKCPIGTHIDADVNAITRALTTGHPRLLRAVLTNDPKRAALQGVEITALTCSGCPLT